MVTLKLAKPENAKELGTLFHECFMTYHNCETEGYTLEECTAYFSNRRCCDTVIGIYDGKPYEIFTGKTGDESFLLPKWVDHGTIVKNRHEDGTKSYDFIYQDKAGYEVILRGLDRCFDQEFWNYAKMTSALLRNGIPVNHIVNIISGLNFRQESINSWRNGVCRALKKFIQDGTKQKGVECPNCHQKDTMEFKEGCLTCSNCGYAKCGN